MEKPKTAEPTWRSFVLLCFGLYLFMFLIFWPFMGFIVALEAAAMMLGADLLLVACVMANGWHEHQMRKKINHNS